MAKQNRRRKHAIRRIKERVSSIIPQKDLEDNLDHNKIMFTKKLTNSRSLCYIILRDIPIKFIYSKIKKKIITILPIYHDFIFPYDNNEWFEYFSTNNEAYRIKIFPDAYLETEDNKSLTLIEKWNDRLNQWEKEKKNSEIFDTVFSVAWRFYEHIKKTQVNSIH